MSTSTHRRAPAPSRHVLRWAVAAVVVVAGLVALRQATMNRPDPPRTERQTAIELDVRTNASRLTFDVAATGLWAACATTVDQHSLVAMEPLAEQTFELRIEPALGHHAEARLVGCLEDVIVPRILGDVTSVEHR